VVCWFPAVNLQMTDLPKIAVQRLNATGVAVGIHPDPNLISAFVENSLPGDSRAQMVLHLAHCADCREVVFLSSPDQVTALPAASVPSRWLTWPVLRWGAAVAAVVVVVAAVSLHRQSGGVATSSGSMQQTDAPIAKEKAAAPVPEERRGIAATATPALAPATGDSTANVEGQRPDQLKKQGARVAASPMVAQKVDSLSGALTNEPQSELDKSTTVDVTAQSTAAYVEAVPGRAKDASNLPNAGGGIGGGSALATAAPRPRSALLLPTVAPRWTLTSDGTLQRSLDFGRTWQTVPVASQASFRALAASGKDIWVGGAKGALYHSMDAGQNWTQVQPLIAGQTLTDDIIGVEFPDPLHGKLTTASKEIWTTEDSGQSWRKQ
jgi:hypothetical protein